MAEIDGRLQEILGALERGGATGIASLVLSRIEEADGPRVDGGPDGLRDRFARPDEEDPEARRRRHLGIARAVVETTLLREVDLVPAIEEQLRVLRRRSLDADGAFRVKEVVIASADETAEIPLCVIDGRRREAVDGLLHAWRRACDVMEGDEPR